MSLSASIIRTLLDTWIDEVPEDFSKTSELSILKKVKTYLMLNMLYTDLLVSVYELNSKSKTSGKGVFPKEPAPTLLKKTDPEERKEFVRDDLEESGPKDANECGPKEPRVFAPKEPKEFCFNTLDVLVDNMLTAVQDGDRNSLIAFLYIYPMCATIQQVLDVLFRQRESRMWSCCFQFCGGSDLNNKKSRDHGGGHGGARWVWVHSWLQRLWPFGQKETTLNQGNQAQDHTDQEEDRNALIAFMCTSSMNSTIPQVLDLLFRGYDCEGDEEVKNFALAVSQAWSLARGGKESPDHWVCSLCLSAFIIHTLLDTWIDKVPEDFSKTSELSILKKVKTYLMLNMLYTDLLVSVYDLHSKSKTSVQ
ncbi:hypothetical protein LEMLEM_LOCUS9903 [Lemmus lemmus]